MSVSKFTYRSVEYWVSNPWDSATYVFNSEEEAIEFDQLQRELHEQKIKSLSDEA